MPFFPGAPSLGHSFVSDKLTNITNNDNNHIEAESESDREGKYIVPNLVHFVFCVRRIRHYHKIDRLGRNIFYFVRMVYNDYICGVYDRRIQRLYRSILYRFVDIEIASNPALQSDAASQHQFDLYISFVVAPSSYCPNYNNPKHNPASRDNAPIESPVTKCHIKSEFNNKSPCKNKAPQSQIDKVKVLPHTPFVMKTHYVTFKSLSLTDVEQLKFDELKGESNALSESRCSTAPKGQTQNKFSILNHTPFITKTHYVTFKSLSLSDVEKLKFGKNTL